MPSIVATEATSYGVQTRCEMSPSIMSSSSLLPTFANSKIPDDCTHLLAAGGTHYRVPRFLLNDIVRFWRTMAVDFASKQRDRGGQGWGLRNAKLRMSRRLIFASGLLVCFSCALDPKLNSRISTDRSDIRLRLVNHIRDYVKLTPLEIVAKSMKMYAVEQSWADKFFLAYADFLSILDDNESRKHLDNLRASESRNDATFSKIRKISQLFEGALDLLFFEHEMLAPLTRKYAVF
jgi:hypothetical protein